MIAPEIDTSLAGMFWVFMKTAVLVFVLIVVLEILFPMDEDGE